MPVCPFATKKLIPPGGNDPAIKPRVAVLHSDGGNAYDLHDYFDGPSGGIESHFHIAKDGALFQYRDTGFEADANRYANPFAVSIETQGTGYEEWTPEQIATIKQLLRWLHDTHGIPLVRCPEWDGAGVGYHIQFGSPGPWTPRVKICPGPHRIKQFNDVLVPWMSRTKETNVTLIRPGYLRRGLAAIKAQARRRGHRRVLRLISKFQREARRGR